MNEIDFGKDGDLLWFGHRGRLRSRVEKEGWGALKSHEMLEVLMGFVHPRQDMSELAHQLVERFTDVGGVLNATRQELEEIPGMTPRLSGWLLMTGHLVFTYCATRYNQLYRLICYRDLMNFLEPRRDEVRAQRHWLLCADFEFNLITIVRLEEKYTWWNAINVRRMMEFVLGCCARYAYLIVRSDACPPDPGEVLYNRLDPIIDTMHAAGVDLLDFVLVGSESYYSARVHGGMRDVRIAEDEPTFNERYFQ